MIIKYERKRKKKRKETRRKTKTERHIYSFQTCPSHLLDSRSSKSLNHFSLKVRHAGKKMMD